MARREDIDAQLYAALEHNEFAEFRRLVEEHPDNLRLDHGADIWLKTAARDGKLPLVKFLVEKGIGVDESEYPGESPLMHAAWNGHLEVVRWLLDHGAKVNHTVQGKVCSFALTGAARHGHLDVVKLLVERGADIHHEWGGTNPLMEARMYGGGNQKEVAEYLESLGARDLREITPPDFPASHDMIRRIMANERGKLSDWTTDVPGDPPVRIHATRPSKRWKSQTVFTVGMSDRILQLPEGRPFGSELMLMLPPDWPLTDDSLQDPLWNWPVEWIGRLAREALDTNRWPKQDGAVFVNGDPPRPFAPNTRLCAWVCLLGESATHQMPDFRRIALRTLIAIHDSERRLVEAAGHEALVRRFEKRNLPLWIDVKRRKLVR